MTDLEAAQPWAVGATHDVVPVRGPRPVLVRAGIGVAFTAIANFVYSSGEGRSSTAFLRSVHRRKSLGIKVNAPTQESTSTTVN